MSCSMTNIEIEAKTAGACPRGNRNPLYSGEYLRREALKLVRDHAKQRGARAKLVGWTVHVSDHYADSLVLEAYGKITGTDEHFMSNMLL